MHRDLAGSRLAKSFYYSYKFIRLNILHCALYKTYMYNLIIKSNLSSPSTADVFHVTISVTVFPVTSLLLVGTVLYLFMVSVTAFSGRGWLRRRDRVTEPLAWLMARDWTASAVKSATCTPSTSTVYRSVG